MPDGVLLDTSFLISFANPNAKNHAVARRYFDHFVEESVPMFLSTIAAAEFHQRQPVTDLPLDAIITLPFNLDDAMRAAELDFTLYKGDPNVPRAALKDDFKLLGQAKSRELAFLVTEDARTLYKYCEELRSKGLLSTRPRKLEDGFERSFFDPTGQQEFGGALQEPPTVTPPESPS